MKLHKTSCTFPGIPSLEYSEFQMRFELGTSKIQVRCIKLNDKDVQHASPVAPFFFEEKV
jgi:hypothetical protein